MKKIIWFVIGAVLTVLSAAVTYFYLTDPARLTTQPEFSGLRRSVLGNVLSSTADPAVLMTFSENYTYLGGQTFTLYGTAEVEQHFFVEEHPDGTLKSFFWLQFEGFLPDNDYAYDYTDSPLRVQIGDFGFYTDTAAGVALGRFQFDQPGTDGYLVRQFLADEGYRYPDEYTYARLVHVPDAANRKELLIIFIDDLAPTGWNAKALREGGENEDKWAEVEAAHLEKIESVMKLDRH